MAYRSAIFCYAIRKTAFRTQRLGIILYNIKPVFCGKRHNRLHIARLPVQMHRNNRPCSRRNCLFNAFGRNVESFTIYICKHGSEAEQPYDLGRSHIGKGRDYHLVAWPQPERHKGYLERIGSVGTRYHMPASELFRKIRGKPAHLRTVYKGGAVEDLRNTAVYLFLDFKILTVKVYHLYLHLFTTNPIRKDALPEAILRADGNLPLTLWVLHGVCRLLSVCSCAPQRF